MPFTQKNAILITYPNPFAIAEAKSLSESIGYSIIDIVYQKQITKSKYGIGKGKAEQVSEKVKELNADLVIFDEILKPSQQYNLTSLCKVEVIDREKLILEIFLNRAVTNESKIQVKLAQLKYEIVRAREKIRLAKKGEQPGFFGLGRTDEEVRIIDIKRRTASLKKKLQDEEKKRNLHRIQRLSDNTPLISLTGYTSAGKTSLFNFLTQEKKETSKTMFTTLTTYTRASKINDRKVFFSDTIGFISKLPPYMIEAFKSTLSELNYADIILLIIDFSDPSSIIKRKLKSSLEILSKLEIPNNKLILVLNKIDLVQSSEIENKLKELNINQSMNQIVLISVKSKYNINVMMDKIGNMLNDINNKPEVMSKETHNKNLQ